MEAGAVWPSFQGHHRQQHSSMVSHEHLAATTATTGRSQSGRWPIGMASWEHFEAVFHRAAGPPAASPQGKIIQQLKHIQQTVETHLSQPITVNLTFATNGVDKSMLSSTARLREVQPQEQLLPLPPGLHFVHAQVKEDQEPQAEHFRQKEVRDDEPVHDPQHKGSRGLQPLQESPAQDKQFPPAQEQVEHHPRYDQADLIKMLRELKADMETITDIQMPFVMEKLSTTEHLGQQGEQDAQSLASHDACVDDYHPRHGADAQSFASDDAYVDGYHKDASLYLQTDQERVMLEQQGFKKRPVGPKGLTKAQQKGHYIHQEQNGQWYTWIPPD